jgi:cell division protein FtsA
MIRNISIGIDIGSANTRLVIAENKKGEKYPRIIFVSENETKGVRHGYISDKDQFTRNIKKTIINAEKNSGIKINKVSLSVSPITTKSEIVTGTAIISKTDGEVTYLDKQRSIEDAENNLKIENKRIIDYNTILFKLDGKEIFGDNPEGLHGLKLESKVLFYTCLNKQVDEYVDSFAECDIVVEHININPIPAANIILSDKQKIVGCALVNIGSDTTSMAVFENNHLIYLKIFPIGSSDITNDIALGLKIPIEKAESLKIGSLIENDSKKKLDEIIEARLSDIFELINNHLTKIKRNELLPAGIIWIGGGSNIKNLEKLSKEALKLPTKIGHTELQDSLKNKLKDPAWLNVIGLIQEQKNIKRNNNTKNNFYVFLNEIKKNLSNLIKQLMP